MRKVIIGLLLLCAAPALFATSVGIEPCPTGKSLGYYLDRYQTWAAGCYVGDWTYSGFSYELVSFPSPDEQAAGTLLATAYDIMLTPPEIVTEAFAFSSKNFQVDYNDVKGVGNIASYRIGYTIDPYPPVIPGFETEMDAYSPEGGGIATINTLICVHLDNNPLCGELHSFDVVYDSNPGGLIKLKNAVFFTPTNWIDVLHTITLEASIPSASSQINGLGSKVVVTPEPASFVLGGAGLCALALLRKRRSA